MAENADERRAGSEGADVIEDGATAKGGYGERNLPGAGASEQARRHAERIESHQTPPPDPSSLSAEPDGPAEPARD